MERSTFNRLFGGAPSRLTAADVRRFDNALRAVGAPRPAPASLATPNRAR